MSGAASMLRGLSAMLDDGQLKHSSWQRRCQWCQRKWSDYGRVVSMLVAAGIARLCQ